MSTVPSPGAAIVGYARDTGEAHPPFVTSRSTWRSLPVPHVERRTTRWFWTSEPDALASWLMARPAWYEHRASGEKREQGRYSPAGVMWLDAQGRATATILIYRDGDVSVRGSEHASLAVLLNRIAVGPELDDAPLF